MFKAELKERWGNYCDTDKLVADMMLLLAKYHHDCTEHGVCAILDEYFTNKRDLIDMFIKSDKYIGNMRICVDIELARDGDGSEIINFCEHFHCNVGAFDHFMKMTDENGKSLADYTRIGVRRFSARQLHYGNIEDILLETMANRSQFKNEGYTKKSYDEYVRFYGMICQFKTSLTHRLDKSTVEGLTQYKINGKFVEGMKTSRAFNRVCSLYGVDKLPNYNRLFAEYADMVSGLKRKLKFYISLNPLDYLTMSFGKSWASCHTIDKRNERGMANSYSGMYCGGTLSYMLDGTSIITYIHDHETEDHEKGKLYRNMFHFGGGTLVQGRIYPQGNDGATDLYRTFRRFMQIELTQMLGLNADDWLKKDGCCSDNIRSYGVHYRDYDNFSSCNTSYPREMPNARNNIIYVGHSRICPYCGQEVSNGYDTGYLCHDECPSEDEAW